LGTVYQQLADYGNAKNQLENAVALNPNLSVAYYHLGAVYSRMGLTNESKAAYEKFRLTRNLQEEENLDPAASAVVSEESQAPRANSRR
jgi:tetratricopeptide (TPR) repeat protein